MIISKNWYKKVSIFYIMDLFNKVREKLIRDAYFSYNLTKIFYKIWFVTDLSNSFLQKRLKSDLKNKI